MDNIIEPTIDYDFSKLYLGPPSTLAGGAYFTRLMYNTNKQLFIQTPKCLTKQGFVKSGKRVYADLMFDNNDTVFINWVENLETTCQELIFNKGQHWFETKLEKDDIETAFTSPFKIFKSGKYYLLRVNVNPNIKIYDENDRIISTEDISHEKMLLSILEIQGIKFSSRNFQIEIELKQAMIVRPDPFLDECFIKKPVRKQHLNELSETTKPIETTLEKEVQQFIVESAKDLSLSVNEKEKETKNEKETNKIDLAVSFNEQKTKGIEELEEGNIVLDIEELNTPEDPNSLKEVDLALDNLEPITLKKPNQVYYEMYQKAREKAKEAKKNAILAFVEMKNIKKTYMLDDIDDSDSEFDGINSDYETESNYSLDETE